VQGALQGAPAQAKTQQEETQFTSAAANAGLYVPSEETDPLTNFENMLKAAGVDMDAPEVQVLLQNMSPTALQNESLLQAFAGQLAARYPDAPSTLYSQALEASGFGGAYVPTLNPQAQPGSPAPLSQPKLRTQPETGWIQYANGVLVDPSQGAVIFDPSSSAPGSPKWQREVVSSWSGSKILEWRDRLHEYGYLAKEQTKSDSVDTTFLAALQAYHQARYLNGGKAIASDVAGLIDGTGGTKPPLVNFRETRAQFENDVREQYQRIFGQEPSDGELQTWTDFVIRKGMELQKKFRNQGQGSPAGMGATEAEERMIQALETSPQAQFLQDSEEENTALRDSLSRAISVTQSLAG
jgi:hypothetical protein